MNIEPSMNRYYQVADKTLTISNNCSEWADSLDAYLSLLKTDAIPSATDLHLNLYMADPDQIDDLLPLPAEEYSSYETTLLVDRSVPYKAYSKDKIHWKDFVDFGRIMVDPSNSIATVVWLRDSGISTVYANILFGFNAILTLLARFGYKPVHASCTEVHKKGILFTGDSGSGKSTAAYALLSKQHPILADDRILINKGDQYSALSISNVIKLSKAALDKFFPNLANLNPLHIAGGDYYHKVGGTKLLPYKNHTNIDYIMVFERTGQPHSKIERINPARVVNHLFPVTMVDFNPKSASTKFSFLMDMLESVQCCKVYFGTDMNHFASTVEDYVQNNR